MSVAGMSSVRTAPHPPSFVCCDSDSLTVYRQDELHNLIAVDSIHVRVVLTNLGKSLRTPQIDLTEREIENLDPGMLLPGSRTRNDLFIKADDIKNWVDRNWQGNTQRTYKAFSTGTHSAGPTCWNRSRRSFLCPPARSQPLPRHLWTRACGPFKPFCCRALKRAASSSGNTRMLSPDQDTSHDASGTAAG